MKIDRRCFLAGGVGATAGIMLSPLPWKLTDDSSIWSQMWPWTPVPPDGEYQYADTVCTLCPGGCGISVRKVDDRAVKVEGMDGHPVNNGGVCILGLSALQLLYGPTRVASPMKKIDGRWYAISWDEAIGMVADRLKAIRAKGATQQVACLSGTEGGTTGGLLERFLTVYGSDNFVKMPSMADAYELALHRTQGVQAAVGLDVEHSDFIISFGSGVIEGWGSPVRMFRANSDWKANKARLVQVESRMSITAAKADDWIAVNPGTEAVLALGLAHVILSEGLYDATFAKTRSKGFNQWKQMVLSTYSPAQVASVTGATASAITDLARTFAKAKTPLALFGRGQGRQVPGSSGEALAVHALNALVGAVGRTGGIWAVADGDILEWPEMEMDAVANAGIQSGRVDGAGRDPFADVRHLPHRMIDALAQEKYPLQALFVYESNPAYSLGNSDRVREAFEKVPFVVSFSSFMDETAELADLVLPNHHFLERYDVVPTPVGHPKPLTGLARPVVSPRLNTRATADVVIALAKALGGTVAKAFPWADHPECLEALLGDRFETLMEDVFIEGDVPTDRAGFETASGKFQFPATGVEPVAAPGDPRTFPLTLVASESMRLSAGYIGDPPFMIKTVADTVLTQSDVLVEVNPATADALGVSEGGAAVLSTPLGKASVRIHRSQGVMPGLVAMPRGLGHTAYDDFLAGKGENVNRLIGPVADAQSGLDAAWGIRASLSKA